LNHGIGKTRIVSSGTIKGLPDINKAYFDVNIESLNLRCWICSKRNRSHSIKLPAVFKLNGNFKGTIHDYTDLIMSSSFGAAK
jgi:hypothetical protein